MRRRALSTRGVIVAAGVMVVLGVIPARSSGQSLSPNAGAIALVGGVDVTGIYYYRGIPQDETGVIVQPHAAFEVGAGDVSGRRLSATVGLWNSLHTGAAGRDGPTAKLWYQSIFRATGTVGLGSGLRVAATYSANTSPNGLFESIQEVSLRVSGGEGSDRGWLASTRPYAVLAFELDGQVDGGLHEGRYLELGASPTVRLAGVGVSAPVRLGLSVGDYYEGFRGDERFGFLSLSGVVSRDVGGVTRYGRWNIRGGVEFLQLGETNRVFGERQVIGFAGLGVRY